MYLLLLLGMSIFVLMKLYEETKLLLDAAEESLPEIAKSAGVNVHWLGKFKQGKYENPGVRTVQRLHDYLAAKTQAAA